MENYLDREGAEPWLLQAAEKGHVMAESSLGVLYAQMGRMENAEKWIGAAALHGFELARENYRLLFDRDP
jgi:hypothetical protein